MPTKRIKKSAKKKIKTRYGIKQQGLSTQDEKIKILPVQVYPPLMNDFIESNGDNIVNKAFQPAASFNDTLDTQNLQLIIDAKAENDRIAERKALIDEQQANRLKSMNSIMSQINDVRARIAARRNMVNPIPDTPYIPTYQPSSYGFSNIKQISDQYENQLRIENAET